MTKGKTKCPICGTKLKMIDQKMVCKECGYYEQPSLSTQQSAMQPPIRSQAGYLQPPLPPQKKKYLSNLPVIICIIAAILVSVAFVVVLVAAGISSSRNRSSSDKDTQNSIQADNSDSDTKETTSTTPKEVRRPQSEFFVNVAEYIWNKDCKRITSEEYAMLTALQIDSANKEIYYQLEEEEVQSASYDIDYEWKLSDLACFTGLEWLTIDKTLSKEDLQGLDNLRGVFAENDIDSYLDIIPNPEKIVNLGIVDLYFKENLDRIEAFPNLQYLSINYNALEDISALEKLPNLLGLSLENCNRLENFSPIMSMTDLEELCIQASHFGNIDFIENMPNLQILILEDSKVSNIDALEHCKNITTLCLENNTSIEDYSVIGSMEQLNDLTLAVSFDSTLPSFEKLTKLNSLSLKNVHDISPIKDAVNVTWLSMEHCGGEHLEAIASMRELNTLILHNFNSYVDTLEPLTHLSKLEALDLSDMTIYGTIEEIFGMPNLYYLDLTNCRAGIDFSKMPVNETLAFLSLNNLSIYADPTTQAGDKINLSDHYEMFGCFPHLTELYLTSVGIDSIAFVESIPDLLYLDITDNQVTSLKPLEALDDFRAVWCDKNPILETVSKNSGILVIDSEE